MYPNQKSLMGQSQRKERDGFSEELVVKVLGERHGFESEYDMAQWVIEVIVPKVLGR